MLQHLCMLLERLCPDFMIQNHASANFIHHYRHPASFKKVVLLFLNDDRYFYEMEYRLFVNYRETMNERISEVANRLLTLMKLLEVIFVAKLLAILLKDSE